MEKVDLGKEKISKLLLSFSVPCIISLIVNALYNIVDQIFIGWGVGYLGNGATNVVFPITVICLAFALMFGDGSSAYLSLKLGENKKEEAKKGVCNGILACAIISIILCAIILIFLPQLLNIFGCTDSLRQYALDYGFVIALGIPFMMIGTTLNSIIRADGSPKYSMVSMVIGAIINIILDPIAIFTFNMGVKGAAIATIVSQIVSFIVNIMYIKRFKSIKVDKKSFKFEFLRAKTVAMLGVSSFITQMAIVIVICVQNKLFKKYGVNSKFGADIPITVLGIVMKINQILSSIIIGIAAGSQPIVGFNYGARKYKRVKETIKIVLISSLCVSCIAFILFQTIPEKLISIFGSGDELYNEFACLAFRVFLMLTLFNGIQIASGIFFQAIGKPAKSAFLTLSRQILFFTSAAIILSNTFGVMGVLYAGPVSDGLAFLVSATLLIFERRSLNKKEKEEVSNTENNVTENIGINQSTNKNIIITIAREYGSGGRYVGKLLSEKLGIKLYDKSLISLVSDESGLSAEYIEENEQTINGKLLANFNSQYYNNLSNDDNLFIAESNAIKEIASKESCIIVGRCADYILKNNDNVFSVFLYNSDESKVNRAVKYYGLNEKNALKEIQKINKSRENHYKYYTNKNWRDMSNYSLAINVDTFGVEKTADIIKESIKSLDNKKYQVV
ncbi:MAG: MATE family efflux transporter [Clostridia bacterium]|jgi:putative MATE family efflux protein|nr:MATE family efflux transporter [Clostridiaceae bacterium]